MTGRSFPERTTYRGHPGKTRTYCHEACQRAARAATRRAERAQAARNRRRQLTRDLEAAGLLVPLPGMPGAA